MTVDLRMAPWVAAQLRHLLTQRGHAWLLHGSSGLGQYSLGLNLARTWLCEQAHEDGACGKCSSCHAIDVRTHADLCVLMPETSMLEFGWPLSEKNQAELDEKKRKPSKEIRVDAMREAIEFCQRTSARGHGKVVLVFPAECMNVITANTLLKTLEEPPGSVKFILASESANQLLPTIRSRCLAHTMQWPALTASIEWLESQGVEHSQAHSFLKASGGRPEDALKLSSAGGDLGAWTSFPKAMARGDVGFVNGWTAAQLIEALHKLCHDLLARKMGAATRFFDASDLEPDITSLEALLDWSQSLMRAMRTMDHPWNAGLMQEVLVEQARAILHCTS